MPCEIINITTNPCKDYEYAGRGSLWGSPFEISRDGNRDEVIEKYRKYFNFMVKDLRFVNELKKLKNRKLGCYCFPQRCHLEVIKEFVDQLPEEPVKEKIKLGVCGSRGWRNSERIFKFLDKNIDRIEMIITGGCPDSPDEISRSWAQKNGVPVLLFYPAWYKNGTFVKSAGFARNRKIAETCDKLCAWQINHSKGTQNTIDTCRSLGKEVRIFQNDV